MHYTLECMLISFAETLNLCVVFILHQGFWCLLSTPFRFIINSTSYWLYIPKITTSDINND